MAKRKKKVSEGLTAEDMRNKLTDLKSLWSSRNTQFDQMRDLFYLRHYDDAAEGPPPPNPRPLGEGGGFYASIPAARRRQKIDSNGAYRATLSDYTDTLLALRSMIMAKPPVLRMYTDKETKLGQHACSRGEKLLMGVRYIARLRDEQDPVDALVDNCLMLGWGVMYTYWDQDLAQRQNAADGSWLDFPLVMKSVEPDYFYPEAGGKYSRWKGVMYSYPRSVEDINEEWPGAITKQDHTWTGSDEGELMDFMDYWFLVGQDVWHCIAAGDTILKPPTKMSPFYRQFPYTAIMGIPTASRKGDEMGLSLMYAMVPSTQLTEDVLSRVVTHMTFTADPIKKLKEAGGNRIEVENVAGGEVHLGEGQDADWMLPPPFGVDAWRVLEFADQASQRAGLPKIAFGQGPSGVSGYAVSLMGAAGEMKTVLPLCSLETGMSIAMDKVMWLLQQYSPKKKLYVYGIDKTGTMFGESIKGNDLDGLRVAVKFRPRIPQDEVARANRARLLKGVTSDNYVLDEVLELPDVAGDKDMRLVEAFEQSPVVLAHEMAAAAKAFGYEDATVDQFLQAMLGQMPQQPGAGGGPQGPGQGAPNTLSPAMQALAGAPKPLQPDELALMMRERAAMGKVPGPSGVPMGQLPQGM